MSTSYVASDENEEPDGPRIPIVDPASAQHGDAALAAMAAAAVLKNAYAPGEGTPVETPTQNHYTAAGNHPDRPDVQP
jgi:hypothetical protein